MRSDNPAAKSELVAENAGAAVIGAERDKNPSLAEFRIDDDDVDAAKMSALFRCRVSSRRFSFSKSL